MSRETPRGPSEVTVDAVWVCYTSREHGHVFHVDSECHRVTESHRDVDPSVLDDKWRECRICSPVLSVSRPESQNSGLWDLIKSGEINPEEALDG